MIKLGRNYSLTVGTAGGGSLPVNLPLTIEFDIGRNILSSANTMTIKIYNLSEKNRNQVRYNFYNTGEYRPIELQAGYGSGVLPTIFSGNITQASSVREGVNYITTIECMDGGFAFANSLTNTSFPTNTPQVDVLSNLVESLSLYQVQPGALGGYPGEISRGNSYSGSTTDLLIELTNGGFFIDNGKANCIGNSECVPGGIALINAASGLLNTPVLEQTVLSFDMLFEPGIIVGQRIQLVSATEKAYNGVYKVISLKHRGTISPAVCGEAVTSLQMFFGTTLLSIAGSAA